MRFKSHRLRKGRYSATQQAYLITTVAWQRQPILANLPAARTVIRSLKYADDAGWSKTSAFCLMPDHLHWLVQLGCGKTLSELVHSIKSYTAHAFCRRLGVARPWQDGYHDHAIRDYEDLRVMARYVVANPLRAQLVSRIGDYSWWDAEWVGN